MSRNWRSILDWKNSFRVWHRARRQQRLAERLGLSEAWRNLIEDLLDAEEFPGAKGQYGLSADNPVPCPDPKSYFSRLRSAKGSPVLLAGGRFSVRSSVTTKPVDLYPVEVDGERIGIFLCIYAKRNSTKAPAGFTLLHPASAVATAASGPRK